MRALDLHRQGWMLRDIATALGAIEIAVSRWLAAARRGGHEALASHADRRGVLPSRPSSRCDWSRASCGTAPSRWHAGPPNLQPGREARRANPVALNCSRTLDEFLRAHPVKSSRPRRAVDPTGSTASLLRLPRLREEKSFSVQTNNRNMILSCQFKVGASSLYVFMEWPRWLYKDLHESRKDDFWAFTRAFGRDSKAAHIVISLLKGSERRPDT
ncbi:helix-turn-helix domain-containing protein [Singulisphaera sp. Ch08]|uniref:helix-turn-helix domain-containing protein n=1 Tax=Singulisphaera sp. Ch08 TaxID=3120278 RepID=UPI003873920F